MGCIHIAGRTAVLGKALPIAAFLLSVLLTAAACSAAVREVIRIGDGATTFSSMVKEISSARVIFIGEMHDRLNDHITQLHVIEAMHENEVPLAIGLEMFTERDQDILDRWVAGKMSEHDFILAFYRNWSVGWGFYKDILLYARDHGIPLIGLNVPREVTRKVSESGFGSLTEEERKKLPPGITCEIDGRYKDYLRRLFHVKGKSEAAFNNFCEAQVLWDQTMAFYLSRYVGKNPEKIVTVLSGSVHAWKYGMPRQLQRYISLPYKVILPHLPGDYSTLSVDDADFLVIYR
jgi:uncharacterized iron-regulated protein